MAGLFPVTFFRFALEKAIMINKEEILKPYIFQLGISWGFIHRCIMDEILNQLQEQKQELAEIRGLLLELKVQVQGIYSLLQSTKKKIEVYK